jgi:hypothetical protein
MIDNNSGSLRLESNVAKLIFRAVNLFRETGLNELAEKWDKILKNYVKAKSLR